MSKARLSRRQLLQAGGGMAAGWFLGTPGHGRVSHAVGLGATVRSPGMLPDPTRPMGTPDEALKFDHVVIVMMENHSFDNYFGVLANRGQPQADGFRFDGSGLPANVNPTPGGFVRAFHNTSTCQPASVTQAWTPTHQQIDGGRMDGFVATSGPGSMGYFDDSDLPFYYSLASTFTLANRWFCSAPCQTYPNRRFLMAGTAYGLISTDTSSFTDPPPPNGTIFDLLSDAGLSWKNYFTDLPTTAIIPTIISKHPGNLATMAQFHLDCALGTLPHVSLLDCDVNLADTVYGEALKELPDAAQAAAALPSSVNQVIDFVKAQGTTEENPTNVRFGEAFVAAVVNSVMASPAWRRTLLVWTYDEHGGYFDHVPPPAAIPPDSIAPRLGPHDLPGGYDIYGLRVPTVVVSPYSRPHAVTNVVHDHTSILATIEAKWNLPALTYRDANAATLADFLDFSQPRFLDPPQLALPGNIIDSDLDCDVTPYNPPVATSPSQPASASATSSNPSGSGEPTLPTPLEQITEGLTVTLGNLGF